MRAFPVSRLLPFLTLLPASILMPPAVHAAADQPAPIPAAVAADTEPDDDDATAPAEAKPDPSAEKFWRAMKLLNSRQAGDQAAGRKALQESSDLEFGHAQVMLGYCFLAGNYGFPKDAKKAVALFRLAAERGNGFAMSSLGSCYTTGTGVRVDESRAIQWLEAALSENADYTRPTPPTDYFTGDNSVGIGVAGELANDPEGSSRASAHFLLAQIDHRRNKPVEAQAHYVAAATAGVDGRSGIYQAAIEAAVNYAFGRGVPRDPEKAEQMLEQSRRLGARMGVNLIHSYVALKFVDEFAVADLEEQLENAGELQRSTMQYEIAQKFSDKKSKDYNAAEAARWYQVAADNDQVWAMLTLALMHARGELGAPDPAKAFALFEKAGGGAKPRHMLGIANLAICLQQGFGTTRDEARAAELFKKYRSRSIVCYLGTLGQAPAQPISFEEDFQLTRTWAEKKKDPTAQFILASRYFEGSGVKVDRREGYSWLKKAAKAGQGDALCFQGYLYQFAPAITGVTNPAEALTQAAKAYKASGETNNVEGLANYAVCVNNGWGVPRDDRQAIALYEKCLTLEPNHARTHNNLGQLYNAKIVQAGARAMGTADWRDKMLEHYEASVREDPPLAAIHLGLLYYEGKIVAQDLNKAYGYFEQAASVPSTKADAHYYLGYMHEFGQGIPVTYSEAAYHYRLGALEGHAKALRRLVNLYVTGTGVSQDFDRALYWLSILTRMEYKAISTIIDVLLKKQDYANAVKLLKIAVNFPNSEIAGHAHQRLSLCYAMGNGVKKSPKLAEKHFKQALKLGNGDALRRLAMQQLQEGKNAESVDTFARAAVSSGEAAYNLGQMYYFGTGVQKDHTKAFKYLRDAATMNSAEAMVFLATLTWNREAGAPPINEAITLATKAENLGHAKATDLRDRLEKRRKNDGGQPGDDGRGRTI
jgi:TPR repeat protein